MKNTPPISKEERLWMTNTIAAVRKDLAIEPPAPEGWAARFELLCDIVDSLLAGDVKNIDEFFDRHSGGLS